MSCRLDSPKRNPAQQCTKPLGGESNPAKMMEHERSISKDDENERPIPASWRPVIIEIVNAFAKKDYGLTSGVEGVSPVSQETANHIKEYIEDYGEDLIQLPEETWNSSIYIWMGTHLKADDYNYNISTIVINYLINYYTIYNATH